MKEGSQNDADGSAALAAMRADLDRIDERLLDCLRDRLECCKSIARHKRTFGVQMMQEHRIDIVQRRAAGYGREHDIDLEFLHQLYELIIGETCRIEDLLIGEAAVD